MSFPLNSNQAYIKDTGERTTLGAVVGGGGGGSELPEYSEEDSGKVLTVDSEGELTWDTVQGASHYAVGSISPQVLDPTTNAQEVIG